MASFIYRTEELTLSDVKNLYVESKEDRDIVEYLKSPTPVVLVGSRGVGKSFLFRLAENELIENYNQQHILPVYVTFRESSLIHTPNKQQFQIWMISRICSEIIRVLSKQGKIVGISRSLAMLTGDEIKATYEHSRIELIAQAFENSWKHPETLVDTKGVPTLDEFLDSIEDLCTAELGIKRIVVFIDEAAHIFIPEQQRQFFTMFRDLRSAYIKCNAAVYPGVTSYGNTFEPMHDAHFITLNRNISDKNYIQQMKEIVLKQVTESTLAKSISTRGQNFDLLAYASGGNPRHLLKTVAQAKNMDSNSVNKIFREYYKTEIWAEHSCLAEKYPGHREMVDWGREFIESVVLPELKQKNEQNMADGKTSTYIWIDKHAPQEVMEALRLLEYTGIISGHSSGIKASRSKIGNRYTINIGCLISQEATPTNTGFEIAKSLYVNRMTEYGANHKQFVSLSKKVSVFTEPNMSVTLKMQLKKSVRLLDLTNWQIDKLIELNLNTIGDVLAAPESKLMEAYYVAEKRARKIRNVALAAVYEYLSG